MDMRLLIFLLISLVGGVAIMDQVEPKEKKLHHIVLFVVLWLIMGVRFDVGRDYPVYKIMYEDPNDVNNYSIEPMWLFMNDGLRALGFKFQAYFLLTSGFTMLGFYKGFTKLSTNLVLATFVFLLTGIYFETANTVRQCCAMAALMWGYSCGKDGNKWGKIGLYVLSVCMHMSAAFGILLIWLCRREFPRWFLWTVFIFTFALGSKLMNIFIDNFLPFLIIDGKYNYAPDQFGDGVSSGVLKTFYAMICVMLLVLYPKAVKRQPQIRPYINLVIAGMCVYSVFYTFQPLRRLYMYGFMFIIILLPQIVKVFSRKSEYLVLGTILTVFFMFLIKSSGNSYQIDLTIF